MYGDFEEVGDTTTNNNGRSRTTSIATTSIATTSIATTSIATITATAPPLSSGRCFLERQHVGQIAARKRQRQPTTTMAIATIATIIATIATIAIATMAIATTTMVATTPPDWPLLI